MSESDETVTEADLAAASPLEKVQYLMARLRDPQTGCNWDLAQTYNTIAPYTIEEAYEVIDAIERQDFAHLKEELGDLLLQVVFYSQMAAEDGHFTLNDVARHLVEKMVRRHPHVFPDGTLDSRIDPNDRPDPAKISEQWDQIKKKEKQGRPQEQSGSLLDDIPAGMSPLKRAEKLQKQAAKVGFEWPSVLPVLEKLQEEVVELKAEVKAGAAPEKMAEELGDVMFCCVNLCRHLGIDPELLMYRANRKFENRFNCMAALLQEKGIDLQEAALDVMEQSWQDAKQYEGK